MTTFNDRRVAATRELSTMISGEEPLGGDAKFFATNKQLNSRGLSGGGLPRRDLSRDPIEETTSVVDMR